MNVLETGVEWDQTKPWMTIQARNDAANYLFDNPHLDIGHIIGRMATDFELCCQLLFSTSDPRRKPANMPFKLWPYEVTLGEVIDEAVDGQHKLVVDKSRDMGVTETKLVKFIQRWLFDEGFHALLTSRKEELIDSKDEPDTLFERLRMSLRWMPDRFKAALLPGFKEPRHATYMRLTNPANGNTITGEAPVEDFGRQGRYTLIDFDEAASIAELKSMVVSAGDSSGCHLYVSTPKGMNEFYRIRQQKHTRIISVHWMLHPLKAQGLYKVGEEQDATEQLRVFAERMEGKR